MTDVNQLITEHLDIWTSAVEEKPSAGRGQSGIANLYGVKKLRSLIIQLAVSGRLLPQVDSDLPAQEAFEKFDKKLQSAVKLDQRKLPKSWAKLSTENARDCRIKGWLSLDLDQVGDWAIGSGFPKNAQGISDAEIMFAKVSDMNLNGNEREIVSTVNAISRKTADKIKAKIHPAGTVIFPKIGGAIATNKRRVLIAPTAIDNNCLGITAFDFLLPEYLYLYLTSVDLAEYQSGTSVPALSQSTIGKIPFLLPPLEEQGRILAKVDELMALCDALERQTEDSLKAHQTLVETCLAALSNSKSADELTENWTRVEAQFDMLFSSEVSMQALQRAIMELATSGKLVPQISDEEDAGSFMDLVATRRADLVKSGLVKKTRASQEINISYQSENLPEGWIWVPISNLASIGTGATPSRTKTDYYRPAEISWVTSGETGQEYIFETNEKISELAVLETNVSIYPPGTLIIAMYGQGKTRGQISELQIEAGTNQACAAIQLVIDDEWHKKYIKLFFQKAYHELRAQAAGGAQPNLNVGKISATLIPLPPLQEQKRIVSRYEEVIKLLDQIIKKFQSERSIQINLSDTIVSKIIEKTCD